MIKQEKMFKLAECVKIQDDLRNYIFKAYSGELIINLDIDKAENFESVITKIVGLIYRNYNMSDYNEKMINKIREYVVYLKAWN